MRRAILPLAVALGLALSACSDSARFEDRYQRATYRKPEPAVSREKPGKSLPAGLAVAVPQAAYDRPYAGRVVEHYVPLVTARSMCAGHDACNWLARDRTCHIVVPSERTAPVRNAAAYRRWEIAGCNGHPDEVIVIKRRRT